SITGNLAVISVNYGVSIFRLDKKEFGDSAFFINNGVYEAAKEAVIKDNSVYVATATGLKSHEMNVTFPIFSSWNTVNAGNFSQISVGSTIAYSNLNTVYSGNGTSFTALPRGFNSIRDITVTPQNIIVADALEISIFTSTGAFVKSFDFGEQLNTGFVSNSKIFAGTKTSGIKNEAGDFLKPDGPYSNTSYKIDLLGNQVLISSGGRDAYDTPVFNNFGYYHFNGTNWVYPNFFKTFPGPLNVMDAVMNPAKPSEIFFVNWTPIDGQKGIYRMENDEYKNIYASTGNWLNRVAGLTFDENNQLFVSSAANSDKIGFYYYIPASDSFNLVNVINSGSTQKPFTKNGILYIPAPFFGGGGLLIYDYKNTPTQLGDDRFKMIRKNNNLPADGVVSAAIDKNDDVWIGTRIGLRILQNPSAAIDEDNPRTEPIIIEENGVGEELFRDSPILQIEVDGGNQKWVSVDEGGVLFKLGWPKNVQSFYQAEFTITNKQCYRY
ncbi:MAG TPA: hypothetical protein PKI04_11010, partial [Kaistella sp.]|nr:hypothetical protein [Kaistella sp.]